MDTGDKITKCHVNGAFYRTYRTREVVLFSVHVHRLISDTYNNTQHTGIKKWYFAVSIFTEKYPIHSIPMDTGDKVTKRDVNGTLY